MSFNLTLKEFLTNYEDTSNIILEYALDPLDLDNSMKCLDELVSLPELCKRRAFIINNYFKHSTNINMIDIGVNTLIKYNLSSKEEYNLLRQIYYYNKYKPSIDNTMQNYIKSCIRGELGIAELAFEYLTNNYINLESNNIKKELIHWNILQYGCNTSEYSNIIKFIDKKLLTKMFDINKYSYSDLFNLIQIHFNMMDRNFLMDLLNKTTFNPICLNLINFETDTNTLCQLILPSIEKKNEYIDYNLKIDNVINSPSVVSVLKQFLSECKLLNNANVETIYNYLNMMVKDNIIMWLIICYGINQCVSLDVYNFLIDIKNRLEKSKNIFEEKIVLLQKYVRYHQYLLNGNMNYDNRWNCVCCTFENNNILGRLCEICGSNRFD